MSLQDNATFVHVPWFADDQTSALSVGLLLGVPGAASPASLAGERPVHGRNFVLAADQSTLLPVLQSGVGATARVPFLIYLSNNMTLSAAVTKAGMIPVNRPLVLIGKSTDVTSIDLGMQVNILQLGPLGRILLSQVVLENLAPGDARSLALAGPYEVSMSYFLWAVAFNRCVAVSAGQEVTRLPAV